MNGPILSFSSGWKLENEPELRYILPPISIPLLPQENILYQLGDVMFKEMQDLPVQMVGNHPEPTLHGKGRYTN